MEVAGSLSGVAGVIERQFAIGASVGKGQVVCLDTTAGRLSEILDPATVNDYTEGIGVALEAGTYSTTQAAALGQRGTLVRASCSPFQIVRGLAVGGTAQGTAFAEATDGNLLTNTSASAGGTTITDADVGTSEFVSGYAFCLSGANKGQRRIITTHTDNTSMVVTVPFTSAIAVGDTFFRTFGIGNQGLELVATTFDQFNMKTGAAVDLPDTGHAIVWDVLIDIDNQGTPTAPVCEIFWLFSDHAFNSLA